MYGIDFFSGSAELKELFEEEGHSVLSTDLIQYGNIDYVENIFHFDVHKVLKIPDFIWASPPCTTFSVASIGTHWTGGVGKYKPKTKACKIGFQILDRTIELIAYYQKINPKLKWYLENPRGVMRKVIDELFEKHGVIRKRVTVWYCQYGDERGKPTDIWTNDIAWLPKEQCRNYKYDKAGNILNKHCHHQSARRGAKTGTQGRKNAHERSKIPKNLHLEILKSISDNNS